MLKLSDGQCGLCAHFGAHNPGDQPTLVQIRISATAPEDLVEPCALPAHEALKLRVSANAGCAGFTPAKSA